MAEIDVDEVVLNNVIHDINLCAHFLHVLIDGG